MTLSLLESTTRPWIVGHRGAAGEAAENTLDSLHLAVEQQADMVEFDLQLTADGELVAGHDWDLERMGQSPLVIESSTSVQLAQVEVSGPFRTTTSERRLATLDRILATLPQSLPLNLELKRRHAPVDRLASRLARAVSRDGRVLVSSFDWTLLEAVRREAPTLALAPLGGSTADPAELAETAATLSAWSIHCRDSLADEALLSAASDAGRPVLVYTINEPDAARRLFDRGVAGVFTDFPGRLRRQLAEAA